MPRSEKSIRVKSSVKYDETNDTYIFEYNDTDDINYALEWMKHYVLWNEKVKNRKPSILCTRFTAYLNNWGSYILRIGDRDVEEALKEFMTLVKNYEEENLSEADGLSPTASGKEGEDLPGFSSEEFPSSIHPVEEEEAPAEAPWSLKELLEEDSFTISSIDQMEEEESVGVLPNLSEVVGEMSAPTSSRVNREMSAPTDSRDNREMSALNIPTGVWRIALAGGRRPNIEVRKSIIAEVLKPQCVMPPRGTKTWRYLDVLIAMERNRYSVNLCRSRTPEARRENRRMMDLLKDFCARTGCGVCRNRMYANSMLLELLN